MVVSGQLKIEQYAWRGKMVKINFIIYIIYNIIYIITIFLVSSCRYKVLA